MASENPPPLSDEDVTAVLALVTKYTRAYEQRQADLKLRDEIDARIAKQTEQFDKLHAAFLLFGFDSRVDAFKRIQALVGDETYARALDRARVPEGAFGPPSLPPPPPKVIEGVAEVVDGAPADEGPTIRELALEYLRLAGSRGRKASEIQALIEERRKTKLHPKTSGMTLYRLSQDGLARREGRTWFFVPPKAETKNPGGGTPGSNDVFT